jgi:purine nucleosidase
MAKELVTAEYVHGPTGLDGADLPEPQLAPAAGHAVDAITEIVGEAEPGSITICTLGPLTNIGTAFDQQPELAGRIRQLVMMGGGFFEGGNTTPAAEFNVYVDPKAADIVFKSGVPIVMMPLDVTHKALTTDDRLQAFRKLGTPAGDAVAGMLDFYDRHDIEKYGMPGGPLHDPTVIAYLLQPELFGGKECHVEIVADGPAEGMTIVDWWGVTGHEPNALVMRDIDADGFYGLLTELVGRL